jgi:hypothetical protein
MEAMLQISSCRSPTRASASICAQRRGGGARSGRAGRQGAHTDRRAAQRARRWRLRRACRAHPALACCAGPAAQAQRPQWRSALPARQRQQAAPHPRRAGRVLGGQQRQPRNRGSPSLSTASQAACSERQHLPRAGQAQPQQPARQPQPPASQPASQAGRRAGRQRTTACARSSVVLSMFFMMRSTICSTQGFSQPARRRSSTGRSAAFHYGAAAARRQQQHRAGAHAVWGRRCGGRGAPRVISSFCTRSMLMGSL